MYKQTAGIATSGFVTVDVLLHLLQRRISSAATEAAEAPAAAAATQEAKDRLQGLETAVHTLSSPAAYYRRTKSGTSNRSSASPTDTQRNNVSMRAFFFV